MNHKSKLFKIVMIMIFIPACSEHAAMYRVAQSKRDINHRISQKQYRQLAIDMIVSKDATIKNLAWDACFKSVPNHGEGVNNGLLLDLKYDAKDILSFISKARKMHDSGIKICANPKGRVGNIKKQYDHQTRNLSYTQISYFMKNMQSADITFELLFNSDNDIKLICAIYLIQNNLLNKTITDYLERCAK